MTRRLPAHPPGQERRGREHLEPRRKRSYLPQLQNPSWWKTGGWGPRLEHAKGCPAHAPDTLSHEQVVATTLQAVWSKGWDQRPTLKVAGRVIPEADKSTTLPTARAAPGRTSTPASQHPHVPLLGQGYWQLRIPKAPSSFLGLHHSPTS